MKNIRILRIIDILAVELGNLRNMLESACRAFDEGKVNGCITRKRVQKLNERFKVITKRIVSLNDAVKDHYAKGDNYFLNTSKESINKDYSSSLNMINWVLFNASSSYGWLNSLIKD